MAPKVSPERDVAPMNPNDDCGKPSPEKNSSTEEIDALRM